ncbi:MAG: cell division protein ZipA [Pseudomonadota bacterium]
MNDLTIFLIISGIVLVVIIGIFTYLKNNQKMKGEVSGFERHNQSIDDVLLSSSQSNQSFTGEKNIVDEELPLSFKTGGNKADDLEPEWIDNTRVIKAKEVKPSSSPLQQKQKISIVHQPLPEGMTDMIIAMSIQRDNHLFSGDEIRAACDVNNLIFGEMDVFHYPAEDKASTYALFSMANMAQPGTFDIDNMFNLTTPGVSLFMQLPLPMNCLEAYNIFVEQAKALSNSLNGELYDEKFNLLSPQIISHTIEKINNFQRDMLRAEKSARV